jgi:hypothetical protein
MEWLRGIGGRAKRVEARKAGIEGYRSMTAYYNQCPIADYAIPY